MAFYVLFIVEWISFLAKTDYLAFNKHTWNYTTIILKSMWITTTCAIMGKLINKPASSCLTTTGCGLKLAKLLFSRNIEIKSLQIGYLWLCSHRVKISFLVCQMLRVIAFARALNICGQAIKGTRGMSWHQKAMKGVEDCDKLGEIVKRVLIPRFLN
jgi:hypothetical protein